MDNIFIVELIRYYFKKLSNYVLFTFLVIIHCHKVHTILNFDHYVNICEKCTL